MHVVIQVLKRNFAQPTLEDHFDKTVLPKVMQVRTVYTNVHVHVYIYIHVQALCYMYILYHFCTSLM